MLEENTMAPSFTLPDETGTPRSFDEFRGAWVILYFYPKDDTPGCTKEACAFRDNFPFFEDTGLTVIGISKDSSASHTKFKEKYNLPFTLLSDTDGTVSDLYHATKDGAGTRISYLIDENGIIRKTYKTVNTVTHAEDVLADYRTLTAH